MNLGQDDPRLSAWVLGELSAAEAAEVETSLAEDPALLQAAAQFQNLSAYLTAHLSSAEARPVQRPIGYMAVRAPVPPIATVNFAAAAAARRKNNPWPTALTAAAMVALGGLAFFKGRQPIRPRTDSVAAQASREAEDRSAELPTISSPKASPASDRDRPDFSQNVPQTAAPDAADLARNLNQEALPASWNISTEGSLASLAEVQLPLVVGRASYDNVRGWIRDHNQLPPKDAVRIEELANAFPLPSQQETVAFAGLRVACISMTSPWVEGAQLVGVQIANETKDSRSVSWSFRPGHPARGLRILASTDGDGKGSSVLPPNQRTLVLLELASSDSDCGDLVVNSEGRSRRFPAQETKDGGMTQAGLVAAFGLWLRGEGVDDSRLSQILVSAGDDPDPGRADSRRLIRQALSLAAAKRSKR